MGDVRQVYHAFATFVQGDGERRIFVVDSVDVLLPVGKVLVEPRRVLRTLAGDYYGGSLRLDAAIRLERFFLWLVRLLARSLLVVEFVG